MVSLFAIDDFSSLEGCPMPIADRIRHLRQERRWSQAELGERLGVHQKPPAAT
jgi:hypothetical protein